MSLWRLVTEIARGFNEFEEQVNRENRSPSLNTQAYLLSLIDIKSTVHRGGTHRIHLAAFTGAALDSRRV